MEITFKSSDLRNIEDLRVFKDDSDRDIYVSVIIPCYNSEEYIDRCLKSVTSQTIGIEHLQIIVVDDVSTDGTFKKLLWWKERFPKEITVVSYKENMRQGGARNVGIQLADGEYIGFVDSDDWIEPDMYERLFEKTREKKYDIVRGKFITDYSFPGEKEIVNNNQKDIYCEFENKNGWYTGKVLNMENNVNGGIWIGIYRKDIIFDNDVWFPENLVYEDNYWGSLLSLYVKNTYVVDRILYHYFVNVNSTVHKMNDFHHLDRVNIEVLKVEEFKKRGAFETLYTKLEGEFIQLFFVNTIHICFVKFDSMKFMPELYKFMKDRMYEYFPDFMKNPKVSELNAIERRLLSLIEIPGYLNERQFEKIREAYLETLATVGLI